MFYGELAKFSKSVYGLPQAEKLRPILTKLKEYKYLKTMIQFRKDFSKLDNSNPYNDHYKKRLKAKLNALLKRDDASDAIKGEAQNLLGKIS